MRDCFPLKYILPHLQHGNSKPIEIFLQICEGSQKKKKREENCLDIGQLSTSLHTIYSENCSLLYFQEVDGKLVIICLKQDKLLL